MLGTHSMSSDVVNLHGIYLLENECILRNSYCIRDVLVFQIQVYSENMCTIRTCTPSYPVPSTSTAVVYRYHTCLLILFTHTLSYRYSPCIIRGPCLKLLASTSMSRKFQWSANYLYCRYKYSYSIYRLIRVLYRWCRCRLSSICIVLVPCTGTVYSCIVRVPVYTLTLWLYLYNTNIYSIYPYCVHPGGVYPPTCTTIRTAAVQLWRLYRYVQVQV